MIPANFDYHVPATVAEAIGLLAQHGEDCKVLAGGHSLIPAMKLRLTQIPVIVDIGRISDLSYIKVDGGTIRIGVQRITWGLSRTARDSRSGASDPRSRGAWRSHRIAVLAASWSDGAAAAVCVGARGGASTLWRRRRRWNAQSFAVAQRPKR